MCQTKFTLNRILVYQSPSPAPSKKESGICNKILRTGSSGNHCIHEKIGTMHQVAGNKIPNATPSTTAPRLLFILHPIDTAELEVTSASTPSISIPLPPAPYVAPRPSCPVPKLALPTVSHAFPLRTLSNFPYFSF
jgi:hypothetical protein